MQKLIDRIKKELPDAAGVGPEDDLFESGVLTSILLIRLVLRLEKAFGIKIPNAELERRNFKSLAAIAELIAGKM